MSVLFFPNFALADTVVSGAISADTTWSPVGGVYLIDSSFSVAAGATLTIEPGTIIKAKVTSYGGPSIYGKVVAHGTSDLPIHFTSISDDSLGGDSDGYGPSVGSDNRWQGLYFKLGSQGDFDYVNISYAGYGGYGYGDHVGIENDGGDVQIRNSQIVHNYMITSDGAGGSMTAGSGLYNLSGNLQVSDSNIEDNHTGIRIDGGSAIISGNTIKNNKDSTGRRQDGFGLYSYNHDSLSVTDNNFSGNNRMAFVDVSKGFTHAGNTSSDLNRKGFQISGTLSIDLILKSGGLPYIVEQLEIPAGKTLTIEPGVIIKMNDYPSVGNIVVHGKLIARGTPEDKIYVTSVKDDSIGGDTNGDASSTLAAPKSWASIFLERGSEAAFENVVLRYGGYNWNGEYLNIAAAVYQRGANFSATSSVFEKNYGTAIYQDAGTTTISKSEFVSEGETALWSRGGAASISYSAFDKDASQALYNESGIDLGWWWQTKPLQIIDARHNWWGSSDGPKDLSTSTPTGSGAGVSANVLYTPFLTSWPPLEEPVIIIPGIMGSALKNGEWQIDPQFHVYDNLIETLEANGYVKDKDLFTFAYDWKKSNVDTAAKLKEKIEEVKSICRCNKVDIVAHSMGGLVARYYAQSEDYQDDIDQLIFLGTPHRGSPKDYLAWEAGEFPPGTIDSLVQSRYEKESKSLGYANLFEYIHNWPVHSVQELLPTYDYLISATTTQTLSYPIGYPRNIFLEELNQGLVDLLESGIDITNITGDAGEDSTITMIKVTNSNDLPLWQHGYPENYNKLGNSGLQKGVGDGTVPEYSVSLGASVDLGISSSHINLPTEAEEEIYKELTRKDIITTVKKSIPSRMLYAKIFSPADIVIVAPDGRRVGKNFSTGQEINEIPGAFYSGFGTDDEYITIPDPQDGEYKIEVEGTGNGKYEIVVSNLSEEKIAESTFIGQTLPGLQSELLFDVDANLIGELTPTDVEPPSIVISSPEQREYLRSQTIDITVEASDLSGVASTTLVINGKPLRIDEEYDPFFGKLGTSTLFVTSTDNLNNTATATVYFKVIANASSTTSDINRSYDLKWIKDKKTRDALIRQVNGIVKIQKRIDIIEERLPNGKRKQVKVERFEKKVDKILAKLLVLELDLLLKKKSITRDAHNILKEDLIWLINN